MWNTVVFLRGTGAPILKEHVGPNRQPCLWWRGKLRAKVASKLDTMTVHVHNGLVQNCLFACEWKKGGLVPMKNEFALWLSLLIAWLKPVPINRKEIPHKNKIHYYAREQRPHYKKGLLFSLRLLSFVHNYIYAVWFGASFISLHLVPIGCSVLQPYTFIRAMTTLMSATINLRKWYTVHTLVMKR